MSVGHAWVAMAEKMRADAELRLHAPPPPALVVELQPAQIVGPLENGDAVSLTRGRTSIERRTREHFDFEAFGGTYRVTQCMNAENVGPSGRRQDAIVHEYIALTGIGRWAVEYLRRQEEEGT